MTQMRIVGWHAFVVCGHTQFVTDSMYQKNKNHKKPYTLNEIVGNYNNNNNKRRKIYKAVKSSAYK